jgi:DNA-binding transcriptional MerR regulator
MTTAGVPQTDAMDDPMTVGAVAQQLGVTVRTLHHYDEIGLLSPSERSPAGYRLYTRTDLERLASIVVYRRLGLALEDVAAVLDGDGATRVEQLRRQRAEVMARVAQMTALVDAIDHALEAEMNEQPATTEDIRAIFGDGFGEEYQAEAQERWGETDAWQQSQQRTARFTTGDWERVKEETEALESTAAAAPARRG